MDMKVIVGYIVVGGLITVVFFRASATNLFKSLIQNHQSTTSPPAEPQPPKKKQRGSKKSYPKQSPDPPSIAVSTAIEPESTSDDAEFARNLARTQAGTDLRKRDETKKSRAQRKKEAKAAQIQRPQTPTTGPSHQNSSVGSEDGSSPALAATRHSGAAGMNTDYGQTPADSLRIVFDDVLDPVPKEAEWTSVPTKTQKTQQKVVRSEETKKQRQRAAERERQKALNEEAEQKRRQLLEKQLRTARMARGEPAKNGESYRELSAPSESVWSKASQPSDRDASQAAMLDTLDEPVLSRTTNQGPVIANAEAAYGVHGHTNGEGSAPKSSTANSESSSVLMDQLLLRPLPSNHRISRSDSDLLQHRRNELDSDSDISEE